LLVVVLLTAKDNELPEADVLTGQTSGNVPVDTERV
jgi:hypothetical protein